MTTSKRAIRAPTNMDMVTTATVCFATVFLSAKTIFLYSFFRPLKKPGFFSFFLSAFFFSGLSALAAFSVVSTVVTVFSYITSRPLLNRITWFPCAWYGACRICSTSWSPYGQDDSSSLLSCCNCVACIPYMPVLSLCARLPPPLIIVVRLPQVLFLSIKKRPILPFARVV